MNKAVSSLMQLLNLLTIQLSVLHQRIVYLEEIRQCDEELHRLQRTHPSGWKKQRRDLEARKRSFSQALKNEFADFHLNQAVINGHVGNLARFVTEGAQRRSG